MGIEGFVVGTFNFGGKAAGFFLEKSAGLIIPATVGAIGGCFSGAGGKKGALQGAFTGLTVQIFSPFTGKVMSSPELTSGGSAFASVIFTIGQVALPIIATYFTHEHIFSVLEKTPWIGPYLKSDKKYNYTVGLKTAIAPGIVQFVMNILRPDQMYNLI